MWVITVWEDCGESVRAVCWGFSFLKGWVCKQRIKMAPNTCLFLMLINKPLHNINASTNTKQELSKTVQSILGTLEQEWWQLTNKFI